MPVQLTGCALLEMLLRSRNVLAGRQIRHDLLAHPTSIQQAHLRVRKRPFEVDYHAGVGRLFAEVRGIGQVNLWVGGA